MYISAQDERYHHNGPEDAYHDVAGLVVLIVDRGRLRVEGVVGLTLRLKTGYFFVELCWLGWFLLYRLSNFFAVDGVVAYRTVLFAGCKRGATYSAISVHVIVLFRLWIHKVIKIFLY